MKKFLPAFKDDNDKIIALATIIASPFLIFIPALLVIIFLKNYISQSTYEIARAFFNLELLLFLISLSFLIPIIGWLASFILAPILVIFNIIVVIINLCALAKHTELKIPVPYEFL